jgi:hypothetical protein
LKAASTPDQTNDIFARGCRELAGCSEADHDRVPFQDDGSLTTW